MLKTDLRGSVIALLRLDHASQIIKSCICWKVLGSLGEQAASLCQVTALDEALNLQDPLFPRSPVILFCVGRREKCEADETRQGHQRNRQTRSHSESSVQRGIKET